MSTRLTRRQFLWALQGLGVFGADLGMTLGCARAAPPGGPPLAPPEPFSFDRLRQKARQLAAGPYRAPPAAGTELVDRIDYDVNQRIRFRPKYALWSRRAPIVPMHPNRGAHGPVHLYVVERGMARRVAFSPSLFDYDRTGLDSKVPSDLGFSGFRVMNTDGKPGDWLVFQGASYFRSAGPLNQYGMSARGIAVDTAVAGRAEQFPRFAALWLEEPAGERDVRVYALLDGPSLTGAYRFDCRNRGVVVMDVHAELFQRAAIERLGIAPLTSMYWYSETNSRLGKDWRPELHDCDGLALWTGRGERIWRPLNDPPQPQTNSFHDSDPKGFGLLQRDRDFDHYLDDGAYYHRRPSVWVEPKGKWGQGAVMLVELPTNSETVDNIVAFWKPDRPAASGATWTLDYRLHWVSGEPFVPRVARVVATRLGQPGIPGEEPPSAPGGRKFVVELSGGPLTSLPQRFDVECAVTASRGTISNVHVLKILGTDRWKASFDLFGVTGQDAVDLRCYVRLGPEILSETWLYQYFPGNYGFDCR